MQGRAFTVYLDLHTIEELKREAQAKKSFGLADRPAGPVDVFQGNPPEASSTGTLGMA